VLAQNDAPRDSSSPRVKAQYSIVIPVYGNELSLEPLTERLAALGPKLDGQLEVVFVVDGSPDRSGEVLARLLPDQPFASRLIYHSRNFGSFAAIRTGLQRASGSYLGVMAADLQEPPELMMEFFTRLASGSTDLVIGVRRSRGADPTASALGSRLFWALYRRLVQREMPVGGVDVFACSARVRDVLCRMEDVHTSLVAQLFWIGFRRELVSYDRRPSQGVSGWTLRRKLRYLSDSVFAFTELPVRLLWLVGVTGMAVGLVVGTIVLVARATGTIAVPGYAATVLILLLFLSLNSLGLGIIGSYVWRAYDTIKQRPGAIVRDVTELPVEKADA